MTPQLRLFESIQSSTPNYRLLLREELKSWLRDLNPRLNSEDLEHLTQLEQLPRAPGYSISLSHCAEGALVGLISDSELSLGVDVELTQRVSEEVVRRVGRGNVLELSLPPAWVWVAKEAALKAFAKGSWAELITDVELMSFDHPSRRFTARSRKSDFASAFGQVEERASMTIAWALAGWSDPAKL